MTTGIVHESKAGTYHPAPCACGKVSTPSTLPGATGTYPVVFAHDKDGCTATSWTINDTRGTIDTGPACNECGACECEPECSADCHAQCQPRRTGCDCDAECIGLSFAFVCLDGGETLCKGCASKAGVVVVPCDCP